MEHHESSPHPTLEEVQSRFEAWRQARKRRTSIPARLWKAAVGLAGQYSTHKISRTLRLNSTELKKRISLAAVHPEKTADLPSPAVNFIEYSGPAPGRPECHIEMETRHGDKMRIYLSGDNPLDLLTLGRSFWSREP